MYSCNGWHAVRQAGLLTISTKDLRGMHTSAEDRASLPVCKLGISKRVRKPDDCWEEYSGTHTSALGMRGRWRRLLALTAVIQDSSCTCSFPAFPLRDVIGRGGRALALTALRIALMEATTSATAAAAAALVAAAAGRHQHRPCFETHSQKTHAWHHRHYAKQFVSKASAP